jgi:hypothetical protein
MKPQQVIDIDLEQAMSYNSMVELQGILPDSQPTFQDTAIIACALKNQKIHIIVLMPQLQTYQFIRTLHT